MARAGSMLRGGTPRRLIAVVAVLLTLLGPAVAGGAAHADEPVPKFDLARAVRELRTDPVYIAPGSQAGIDAARLRRELPPLRASVVVAPVGTELRSYDFKDIEGHLIMVSGLHVTSNALLDVTLRAVLRRYLRQALETYDVTGLVYAVAAASVNGGAVGEEWEPAGRPAEDAETRAFVAALSRQRVYAAPGVAARGPANHVRAAGDIPYRVLILPPSPPGATEPRLLPALTKAFPGDVIVVVRGLWLTAAGPDAPATLASAQRYAMSRTAYTLEARTMKRATEWYDVAWALEPFFERLAQLRAGRQWRPPPGPRLHVAATAGRLAPWAFAVAALLLGVGALAWWSRNTAKARLTDLRAVRVGRAEILAEMARLAADIHGLEPGDDGVARRRLAEAAERYATAGMLYDEADTPEEVTAVKRTLAEGLVLAGEVRDRLTRSRR